MIEILTASYGLGGIIAALFHIPQLLRLWRTPEAVHALSLVSWLGWFLVSCNSTAYAALVNRDPVFLALCALNLACQAAVLACMARAYLVLWHGRRALGQGAIG